MGQGLEWATRTGPAATAPDECTTVPKPGTLRNDNNP
jgi:hypothetical protein